MYWLRISSVICSFVAHVRRLYPLRLLVLRCLREGLKPSDVGRAFTDHMVTIFTDQLVSEAGGAVNRKLLFGSRQPL